MQSKRLAFAAAIGLATGCGGAPPGLASEGEPCRTGGGCAAGLACVAGVGAEHGHAPEQGVCEPPSAVYEFLHFGERGANRRVDEALAMLRGEFRLPRLPADQAGLAVVPHALSLVDGERALCHGLPVGARGRDCLVPDWAAYYGEAIPKYGRFILFGLRFIAPLVYFHQHASDDRIAARVAELVGAAPGAGELERLRLDARNAAIAVFDSFVSDGHHPFALDELPSCYSGSGGYQNPNASWAPALDQWDPALRLDGGRLRAADDVPVACDEGSPTTYAAWRDSLWDQHATAYRALSLRNAYQLFRGLLPDPRRRAWLRVLRETGDALALPSSYEPGNNHGITEAVALLQLGHDLRGVSDGVAPGLLPSVLTEAWLDLGRHRLNDVLGDTVFPDGVQAEQSPFYHNYQLALMLQIGRWLGRSGVDLAEGIDPRYASNPGEIPPRQRRDYDAQAPAPVEPDLRQLDPDRSLDADALINRMVRAAILLAQPDGSIPLIGSSLPQQLRGYQAAAFEPFADGDGPMAAQLRFFWSEGERGTPPPDRDRLSVFEDSGFVTLRSGFERPVARHTHLVFNTGLPWHRHSHADALAIHLYGPSGGPERSWLPLLIDPGWYSYRAEGRHHFESTRAHDTVSVDGANQCTRVALGKRAAPDSDAPLESCSELAARAPGVDLGVPAGEVRRGLTARGDSGGQSWLYQSAAHGLYEGVAHRRAVVLIGAAIVIVIDELRSSSAREFVQSWQITPEAGPSLAPPEEAGGYHLFFRRAGSEASPLFSLHEAAIGRQVSLQTLRGEPPVEGVPGPGWYSTSEEQMESHTVIEVAASGAEQALFGSVFLMGELAAERPDLSLQQEGPGQVGLTVALGPATLDLQIDQLAAAAPDERLELRVNGQLPGAVR